MSKQITLSEPGNYGGLDHCDILLGGKKVGFVFYSVQKPRLILDVIFIHEHFRKKGCGRAAMKILCDKFGITEIKPTELSAGGKGLLDSLARDGIIVLT